ncbi:NAD(P)H-binding protein [Hoyosella subflava]|uniref:NAD(P)-binding domain-containing protein n=1 Tax=Hoyosella subflava (strain DSM 45089 / JCM 17490 / NBRC 109087 / DQS3-9A1) TaxID=443218 RepID=F6EGL9_HOYSD|nr:NAD(P)H-binding protein [Hoyosella subflava]AEF41072.1 hypothetical protein AS9A_2625 [Hoyosella subflava DQS3-9A1]
MTILVTGATANIGRLVVDELLELGATDIRALTANPAKAQLPECVDVVEGYVGRPETLTRALAGVERMYLAPVVETAGAVTAMAREAGVEHIVDLAGGGWWRPVEEAVENSGVPWTHLGPGEFMWNTEIWADQIKTTGAVRDAFPEAANAPIAVEDIADVAARTLTEGGHIGRAYELTGPETLTRREMVRQIGEALGREIPFIEVSREEAIANLIPAMGDQAEWYVDIHAELIDAPQQANQLVEELTGRPAMTFAEWARRNTSLFQ